MLCENDKDNLKYLWLVPYYRISLEICNDLDWLKKTYGSNCKNEINNEFYLEVEDGDFSSIFIIHVKGDKNCPARYFEDEVVEDICMIDDLLEYHEYDFSNIVTAMGVDSRIMEVIRLPNDKTFIKVNYDSVN
jgi:hypothetical protein